MGEFNDFKADVIHHIKIKQQSVIFGNMLFNTSLHCKYLHANRKLVSGQLGNLSSLIVDYGDLWECQTAVKGNPNSYCIRSKVSHSSIRLYPVINIHKSTQPAQP